MSKINPFEQLAEDRLAEVNYYLLHIQARKKPLDALFLFSSIITQFQSDVCLRKLKTGENDQLAKMQQRVEEMKAIFEVFEQSDSREYRLLYALHKTQNDLTLAKDRIKELEQEIENLKLTFQEL